MGFYNYRGRGCGRILGYLEKYCSLRIAEEATVYSDKVTYFGDVIATYTWDDDSDVATFKFNESLKGSNYWTRNQRIYKPYFDVDPWTSPLTCNYEYILQEIRARIEDSGLPLTRKELRDIIQEFSSTWHPTDDDLEFVVSVAHQDIQEENDGSN